MPGCRNLTLEEICKIVNSFKGATAIRNKTLFLLGCNTGFRVSELCSLRIRDVVDEYGLIKDEITVDRKRMKGKKHARSIPLNNAAKKILQDWLHTLRKNGYMRKKSPLFPTTSGKSIDRIGAWRIINTAKKKCGLRGKVATHSMRKTFGHNAHDKLMEAAANGEKVDVWLETAEILGHANPKNTITYLSGLDKRKKTIIEQIGIEVN